MIAGMLGLVDGLAVLLAKEDLEWRFEGAPQPYQLFLVVLGILAFVTVAYLLEPKAEGRSRYGRILLGIFRAAALLLAVAILFRPVERKETRETKDGYVVVAIDRSRSMSLKDREGSEAYRTELANALRVSTRELRDLDRLGRVQKALLNPAKDTPKNILERLAEKNRVKVYTFDATKDLIANIEKLDPEGRATAAIASTGLSPEVSLLRAAQEVKGVKADGAATALGDSLQKILTDLRSEKVGGLIVLSDGRSNAGSLATDQVAARYAKKGIPIFAVGVGDPNPPKDLSIENLEAPDVTIAGDVVNFQFVLKAQGYDAPRDLDVELVFDGQVVKRERVQLGGPKTEMVKGLEYKPEKEGEFNVEVRVVPDEAEITAENNKAFHHIRVIAQRIKVLYIEGYPRWEYRYLKNALCRDAKIDAQCFLLSADPGFPQESSRGVPSLKAFPTREELFTYHVIVFGDVNPQAKGWDQRDVFPEGSMEAIREFVGEQGGGFLMISGEQDSPRRYAQGPLKDLLPVVIDEQEGSTPREWSEVWHPRLTREGVRSPLLRLEPEEEKNRGLWEGANPLPGFFWYTRALKAKPLARVLAEHPTDRNQNGNFPIWAFQYYKSGTVFWSATDESWRWRSGVGDRYMYRFWGQILRFLAHGRFQRSKRFLLTTDKAKYIVGEEARIQARVQDRQFRPSTEKSQEVVIDRPDAQTEKLDLKLVEGRPGYYEGRFRPVKMGNYRVSIDPGQAGSDNDVAPRLFEVKFPSIELEEPRMDKESLEALAKASGGEFLLLDKLGTIPDKISPMTETVAASASERELWDNHMVLMAFAAILIAEWIGRKVARLL